MKFRNAILVTAVALGACTYAARSTSLSTLAPDAAYTCALQQVNRLGYTVTISERAGGLLKAERQTASGVMQFMTSSQYFDEITVSVAPSPNGGASNVTVDARSTQAKTVFGRQVTNLTKQAKADADTVRARCSKSA